MPNQALQRTPRSCHVGSIHSRHDTSESSLSLRSLGILDMLYFVLKVFISALVIAGISEVAKRSSFLAAVLASLPLTSLLAFLWLYRETADVGRIAELSYQIFWLVIPSLALFIALPWLLRRGVSFWPSLGLAVLATMAAYFILVPILRRFGVQL